MKKFFAAAVLTTISLPALAGSLADYGFTSITDLGLIGIASGLAIGMAAIGGGLGQAYAATAALEGIARNPAAQPKIFVPMIIALALIESLVIYALVVSFGLNGFIGEVISAITK